MASTQRLVTLSDPRSPVAEAYRTLRSNIQFSNLDHPARTILVTSAGSREGKSATLCNLAVTLAQSGTKTVVVDCDMRHPAIHEMFDLANNKGLSTLLSGPEEALPIQATAVPNLSAITSGPLPSNPADLLSTQKMQSLLESLADSAEMVLLDAPPLGFVADAAILASRVDGAILVVTAGKTRRDVAARAKATLEKANARVLGVVLHNARVDSRLLNY